MNESINQSADPVHEPFSQSTNQSSNPRHGGGVGPQGKWIRRPRLAGCSCDRYHANSCQFLQICNPPLPRVNSASAFLGVFFACSGPKMAQKITFLQTCFSSALGCALGRVHDGFGAQHDPNLGRFWSHVGANLGHFLVFFWHLNLKPL